MGAIWLAFGRVFYMQQNAIAWFLVCSVLLGLGGANFIVYSFWLPEQYSTECRASAFAFITNFGRFTAAGFTFMVGAGIRHMQTVGIPVALTAIAFAVGLALVPFGRSTTIRPAELSAANTSPLGATRRMRGPSRPDANRLTSKPFGTIGF